MEVDSAQASTDVELFDEMHVVEMACGGIGGAHCRPFQVVHGREPIHSFGVEGGLGGGAHCLPRDVQSREPFLHSSWVDSSCQTSWTMEVDADAMFLNDSASQTDWGIDTRMDIFLAPAP
eukprot:10313977-Karenia_brevis.AAC.1